MAKWLALAIIPLLLIGVLAGCGEKEPEAVQKLGFLPMEKIEVKANEEFTIRRGFDLNSGYIWREKYDETMLELLSNEVDTETREDGKVILYQVFRFRAKQKGNTQILLAHVKPTLEGKVVRAQNAFDVYIK